MGPQSNQAPLVTIVGETASGKSALALELAQQFGGEIIAADSRTIYRGLDIGTAKPTVHERKLVSHHLLDVVDADERFSAAQFKHAAEVAIASAHSRGKLPFLVGGSGLYVDAVLFNFSFQNKAEPNIRERLQKLSIDQLQAELIEKGIPLPANKRNPRHLIRAIETRGQTGARQGLRPHTLVLGISINRDELRARVAARVDQMLHQGFEDELKEISDKYGWDVPALQAPGYKAFRKYLEGEMNLAEATQILVHDHLQLAKRQRTWFRRNKSIHWISKKEEAVDLVTTFLSK
ncbi:MAG TPA: tRNA (adenosine(37)-N6)-dimethylallyltransferase MiaA [Candidatus Saccharimonadales bacterium]